MWGCKRGRACCTPRAAPAVQSLLPQRGPQVAGPGAASPCPLPSTFKTAWKVWSGKWKSRCGTETGGAHLPHRLKTTSLSLSVFISIWQNRDYYFFHDRIYSAPPSRRFRSSGQARELCFVEWLLGRRIRVPGLATVSELAARLLRTWLPLRGVRSERSGDCAQPLSGGSAVPLTGWGQQAQFAFSSGEGGMWRRRRGREREVLLPPLPAGCGGRCFPARTPLCVSRGSGAALVCGPSSIHPSRGCGSAPPAVSPVPDPPRPTGPEGCSGGRRWSERAEGEDQRESPPPDALTPPPSSPSLQLGASARGRSRLLRSPRSAAPARQRGRVAGGCGQKGPFARTAPGSAAASPSAVRRHSGLKGLAFFPVQSREERNG